MLYSYKTSQERSTISDVEVIGLLAMAMALTALGIDMLLPTFGSIRTTYGMASDAPQVAMFVTTFFYGLAVGQLFYGPVSDRFGRKVILYVGTGISVVAAFASALAPTFELVLLARFIWGVGVAGPRVASFAVIRDLYSGNAMSKAMSSMMAVSILIPIISPALGAALVSISSWRWVIGVCIVASIGVGVWTTRLQQTLSVDDRTPLQPRRIWSATRFVITNRQTVGYTLAMTLLYGAFIGYLGSSELIITEVLGHGNHFALIFSGGATIMGVSMMANSRVVERFGTRRVAATMLIVYIAFSAMFTVVSVWKGSDLPLWAYMALLGPVLSAHGFVLPNYNTNAMNPMGAVAGVAASLIGAFQIAVGAALGSFTDRLFDGTAVPLATGFLVYGVLTLLAVLWAENWNVINPFARQ